MNRFREPFGLLFLLAVGLAPRLAMVSRFPTIPFSDFKVLVDFGLHLHDHGVFSHGYVWLWDNFNPGFPLVLCGLYHIFPHVEPGAVARLATAVACGLMPLLPFLIWRGVLPFWVRLLAGAAVGLWPGQILFSGTAAQDNWAIIPTVALGALAVRALSTNERPWLIAASLFYAAGAAVRQELLVMLFPLLLTATGVNLKTGRRRIATVILVVALPLLLLAAYRYQCTGRFALTTRHSGLTILGAYAPGATANGWSPPLPLIASLRPDLLRNRETLLSRDVTLLALSEALRRPGFHSIRILSWITDLATNGEISTLTWSLKAPEAMPPAVREQGAAFARHAETPLWIELTAIQGLFAAALMIAIRRRSCTILVLASAVLLKYGIHAVTNAEGRFFLAATALELMAITLAIYEVRTMVPPANYSLVAQSLAIGCAFSLALILISPPLITWVRRHDVDYQRTYHFPLESRDGKARLDCTLYPGLLLSMEVPSWNVTFRPFLSDPAPGDVADAVCVLTGSGEPRPLVLQVLDPYAPGGFPDRILQRVEIDGVEVYSHDLARDPGSGWANIPLGEVGAGTKKQILVEVKAIRPDPGPGWGNAAQTSFQLARP